MNFDLPHIGEGVQEAELVRWLARPGDTVKSGDILLEALTDKATMEVPAPFTGRVTALKAEPGEKIAVGQTILEYEPLGQPAAAPEAPVRQPSVASPPGLARQSTNGAVPLPTPMAVRAAPSVRQMARKMGIDLGGVTGSGPEGRILAEDLVRQGRPAPGGLGGKLAPQLIPVGRDMPPTRPAAPRQDHGKPGARIPLQGLRRQIADHMAHAKRTIPHYSYVDECDVTDLVRLRTSLKDVYARAGVKLTYLPFFVKAVVAALKEVPIVNASLDESRNEIVLHDHYHIGIAVAAPGGLIVPVVRDADRMDLGTIAREIERLSNDARVGRPRLEDVRGSTFTLTSVGSIGGLFSTPVINHPEVGILGIGKVVRRPVFDEAGAVKPADIVYLSLSFDHRVVDGAVGAAFTNAVIEQLRNPGRLLLPENL